MNRRDDEVDPYLLAFECCIEGYLKSNLQGTPWFLIYHLCYHVMEMDFVVFAEVFRYPFLGYFPEEKPTTRTVTFSLQNSFHGTMEMVHQCPMANVEEI